MREKAQYKAVFRVHLVAFVVVLVGGFFSGSITLWGDVIHAGLHVVAQLVGLIAASFAERHQDFSRASRVKTLGALLNGVLLILIGVPYLVGAVRRFFSPEEVVGEVALIAIVAGLLANYYGLRIYGVRHGSDLLHTTRVHIVLDAGATIAALLSGFLTSFSGNVIWDTILGCILGCVFLGVGGYFAWSAKRRLAHPHLVLMPADDDDNHEGRAS